jgi:error-prone DNA polymerase
VEVLIEGRRDSYKQITALRDAGVPQAALEKLADADAFRSIGLDRRQALWEVSALADIPLALFAGQPSESVTETQISLPLMAASEHVIQDYASTSLSLKAHPLSFVREKLSLLHVRSSQDLAQAKDGDLVKVAGLVLVRQRPGTAKGICFITIEDETGTSNLVVFQKLFDQYRKEIIGAKLLMVEGRLQIEGEVVHVIVKRCFDLSKLLRGLSADDNEDFPVLTLSRADEKSEMVPGGNKRVEGVRAAGKEVFYKGRNFK